MNVLITKMLQQNEMRKTKNEARKGDEEADGNRLLLFFSSEQAKERQRVILFEIATRLNRNEYI